MLVEDACGYRDVFSKCSVAAIIVAADAKHFTVVAQVDASSCAVVAGAAVDRGIHGHAVPCLPVGYSWAYLLNYAGCFVAHGDGRNAAAGRAIDAVYIGAANAYRTYAHEDVLVADFRERRVDYFKLIVGFEVECFHIPAGIAHGAKLVTRLNDMG